MHPATANLPAATRARKSVCEWRWLSSVLAAAVFWTALLAFGSMRPGYSQFTKAVSELGAIGSAHAFAWNLIGFILPGLLLARSGAGIAAAFDPRGRVAWWALVLSGLGFAGTGVFPAVIVDGDPVMDAPFTVAHVAMMLASSACWLVALAPLIRRSPTWLHPLAAALTGLAIAGLAANVLHDRIPALAHRPGLGQRLGFAGHFIWYLGLSAAASAAAVRRRS